MILFFKKNFIFLIIILLITFSFSFRLNRDYLGDWDECVIAQQAKEMKASGNFFTNQFNQQLLLEKPPANNWWIQFPLFFSESFFSYRFMMVLFSLLTLILIFIFCLEYFSGFIGYISIFVLLTTSLFVDFSTKVNTDIGFTFFTFLGFYFWIKSFKKNSFSYFSGLSFGLAVLTKGLSIFPYIGAIFIGLLVFYSKDKFTNFCKLVFIFLLVIVPWHIFEYIKNGNTFLQIYFVEHLFRRANIALDFHFNTGRLFYVKLFLKEFNFWLVSLLIIPISLIKKKIIINKNQKTEIVSLLFLIVILTTFSISTVQTRIAWYALPLYPFISVIIAYLINEILISFKLNKFKFAIYIIVVLQIIFSINSKVRFFDEKQNISLRDDVFVKASQLKNNEINYLVWESERIAEAILPKNMRTSTTFMFGGNPCAVFYSNKKVNYFYNFDNFSKKIKNSSGYYVIYKDDFKNFENLSISVIYRNADYVLVQK